MNIDHIAIASDSEKKSDEFFVDLLGLKRVKDFTVPKELMEKFFGVKKEQEIINRIIYIRW